MGIATTLNTANIDLSFTSAAAAGITVAAGPVVGVGAFSTGMLYYEVQGATGGVLDIYIQVSPDGGTKWFDYAHLPQIAAAAAKIFRAIPLSKSTPIVTTVQTIGTGLTPALAANVFLGGDWGDRFRVVQVAGASTSAGAAQVIYIIATSQM